MTDTYFEILRPGINTTIQEMAPYCQVQVADRKATPHKPVILTIKKECRDLYEYTVDKPAPFPTELGQTVHTQDTSTPNWNYEQYSQQYRERTGRETTLEQHAAFVMTAIEDELIAKAGLQHTEAEGLSQYRGRALTPKIHKTRVAPASQIKGPATDPSVEHAGHISQLTQNAPNHLQMTTRSSD